MEENEKYTDWDISERKPDENQDEQSTVFFFELLAEQRY